MIVTGVNVVSTASAQHDVELDHFCSACGVTSPAWVRGVATVKERRSIIEAGNSDAAFMAEDAAQRNAALLVRIAKCPVCGKRDPSEVRGLYARFAWLLIAVEVVHLLVPVLADSSYLATYAWASPIMALALAYGCWKLSREVRALIRASETRVRYIRIPESTEGPYRSTN